MPIDFAAIQEWILQAGRSVGAEFTSPWFYSQLGLILAAWGFALAIAAALRARIDVNEVGARWPLPMRRLLRVLLRSSAVALFALFTIGIRMTMVALTWPSRSYLLKVAASLAVAWLIIRLATSAIRNEFAVHLVTALAWAFAALGILGLLDPTVDALDSMAIVLGGLRLTPLLVIKAVIFLTLALWMAGLVDSFVNQRINASRDLTPSLKVLLGKLTHAGLITVAVIVVLASVGIDLSSLAIFSSAVGVGVGLGLQKIVSNFVSGIILLTDKSVKPGDLITAGDSFGRIVAMNTRYIRVAAGDGREFLIPNEDLVTQKVVNWTYADSDALVKIQFSTTYDADPREVCRIAKEIATNAQRALHTRPPNCLVTEFAENGLKYTLTFWIDDPGSMDSVRSEVLLALWDAFARENIRLASVVREVRLPQPLRIESVPPSA